MNFLAHIYLSGDNEAITIGNFIADGIKGKKYKKYPLAIQKGILLHREIDTFTDQHPTVRISTARLHKNYGHYSGVIVDILYDHFLAKNWKDYHSQPLDEYIQKFYDLLRNNFEILPYQIQQMMPYMLIDNWLLSYATVPGISNILIQMNKRTKNNSKMNLAVIELEEYYDEFENEFTSFFSELRLFSSKKTTSIMSKIILFFIAVIFISCKQEVKNTQLETTSKVSEISIQVKESIIADKAMVVSAREEASNIGIEILKKGGNAFDAMIATEMALAVSFPFAGNIGGGGFMVYRTQYGEIGALDYREKAPLKASRDMYLDEKGDFISEKSKVGSLALGVPGTIAGIFAVHEKFGSLPIEEILEPVIALANRGFVITLRQADRLNCYSPVFKEVNEETSIYTETYKEGDTLKNSSLAITLGRISQNGRSEFYNGKTGKDLVNFIQSRNGIITMKDLHAYEAEWREPIVFNYKELKIISMSPPSSGGICIAQILKLIEPFPISEYGHNSVRTIQVITEAERRAYADRSFYLGDPDFVDIPVEVLISEDYLNGRMEDFSFDQASSSADMSYGVIPGYESD